jgi:hypothetical protein
MPTRLLGLLASQNKIRVGVVHDICAVNCETLSFSNLATHRNKLTSVLRFLMIQDIDVSKDHVTARRNLLNLVRRVTLATINNTLFPRHYGMPHDTQHPNS